MRRPFKDNRPIGPFADVIKDDLNLVGYNNPSDKVIEARNNITEAYKDTPRWAKNANTCVDWMKENLVNEIVNAISETTSTGDEHTFAVCYDGSKSTVSQIESGGHNVAPTLSCKKDSWKLIDVHTHPRDSPIYPSVTDLRNIVLTEDVPIPVTLNEVVIRDDGIASCLNTFDVQARLDIVNTYQTIDSGNFDSVERAKMSKELVDEHGTEFNMMRV